MDSFSIILGSSDLISMLITCGLMEAYTLPDALLVTDLLFQSSENLSVELGGDGSEKNDPPGKRFLF